MTGIPIAEAVEAYVSERKPELSDSSIQNHRYQLQRFEEWAGGRGDIDCIGDIEPIDISRFRRYRSSDINSNTMYNQLSVLRLFLRFAGRMGWCDSELADSIVLPRRDGRARDRCIEPDRIESIIDDVERYRFASLDHVLLSLLWSTSMRIGALRALDIEDLHLDDGWCRVVHRPASGTSLKNGAGSEREVNLHGWVVDVLDAYLDDVRIEPGGPSNRSPLLTTRNGRIARSSIRRRVYRLTACGSLASGPSCDCGADRPSKCSDSVSPHDIRRSSISAFLDNGHPKELVSDRVDASVSVLEEHYDVRSERAKRELRRERFGF